MVEPISLGTRSRPADDLGRNSMALALASGTLEHNKSVSQFGAPRWNLARCSLLGINAIRKTTS
jgi:hypothetical protein